MIKDPRDIVVTNPEHIPKDTPEVIRFSPTINEVFAVGSWDKTVRVYQIINSGVASIVQQLKIDVGFPVIDLSWTINGQSLIAATGSTTANIIQINLQNPQAQPVQVGMHQLLLGMRALSIQGQEAVFSVGLNNEMNIWMFAGNAWTKKMTVPLVCKPSCFDMDSSLGIIVLGMGTDLYVYKIADVVNGNHVAQKVTTKLNPKGLFSVVLLKPPADGFQNVNTSEIWLAVTGCDGRINFMEFNLNTMQPNYPKRKKEVVNQRKEHILFKPHTGGSSSHHITATGFLPKFIDVLLTASSEGHFTFWDTMAQSHTVNYKIPKGSISAFDVSRDNQFLAMGAGYSWNKGVWGVHEVCSAPEIFIHKVNEADVKTATK